MQSKKPSKADWLTFIKPKKDGRLVVLNLKTHNEAMLLKFLHKFYNKEVIPWVSLIWECHYPDVQIHNIAKKGSFWWKDILKLIDKYKGMATVTVKDGRTSLLWEDLWNGSIPKWQFPHLYSFAKKKYITISEAKNTDHFHSLFHLPLSEEAFTQYNSLKDTMNPLELQDVHDSWAYIWGSSSFS